MFKPKVKTNIDTNFIKIVAIISMFIDHIGLVFFPQYSIFRWIGRISFPLFCYCMTIGIIYTSNINKYILRIFLFALISQLFYILAFKLNIFTPNIFFTLLISLIGMKSFIEKNLFIFIISVLILFFGNLDYNINGLVLMIIFYVFREKPLLSSIIYILTYIPGLFAEKTYLSLCIGNFNIAPQTFSIFALPFIYIKTNIKIDIPKIFFYIFYPAHLIFIFIMRIIFNV